MGENWKPALLLAVIIPLVLGLQLMALWVIDSLNERPTVAVATVEPPPAPVITVEPEPQVPPPAEEPVQAEPETGPAQPGNEVTAALSGWDELRNRRRPAEEAPAGPAQPEEQTVAAIEPPKEETVAEAALEAVAESATVDAFAPAPPGELQVDEDRNMLDLHHAGWLAQRNPTHYTLQVETALTPDRLLTFAGERDLPQPQAYYRSFWEGRDRYIYALVSGDYADWAEARQAAGELARRYPQLKPWVRSFADIQRQLGQE